MGYTYRCNLSHCFRKNRRLPLFDITLSTIHCREYLGYLQDKVTFYNKINFHSDPEGGIYVEVTRIQECGYELAKSTKLH